MSTEYDGPRLGDRVQLTGAVRGLARVGGEPGALVDVGKGTAPVWVPLAQLTVVAERRERGGR